MKLIRPLANVSKKQPHFPKPNTTPLYDDVYLTLQCDLHSVHDPTQEYFKLNSCEEEPNELQVNKDFFLDEDDVLALQHSMCDPLLRLPKTHKKT